MHEGGGRWIGSNKVVELKKKRKKENCSLEREQMINQQTNNEQYTDRLWSVP